MSKYEIDTDSQIVRFRAEDGTSSLKFYYGKYEVAASEAEALELADMISAYINAKAEGKTPILITGCPNFTTGACACVEDCTAVDYRDGTEFLNKSDIDQMSGGYSEDQP